jgi:hypothetical protein
MRVRVRVLLVFRFTRLAFAWPTFYGVDIQEYQRVFHSIGGGGQNVCAFFAP